MPELNPRKTVAVCDTQPITAEGLRILVGQSADLEFAETVASLDLATALVHQTCPDILVVDKGLGVNPVLAWLKEVKHVDASPAIVVWGVSMTQAEAILFLQSGARGIIRKTVGLRALLSCLRALAHGRSWMEDSVFRDSMRAQRSSARPELTAREEQVHGLVEQGFKNKQIAFELGITPGTLKIHLKHIFEKTGEHSYRAGIKNIDLGLFRNFKIKERIQLQARGEAANAFNIVSLNIPNNTLTSPGVGTITSAGPDKGHSSISGFVSPTHPHRFLTTVNSG